MITLAFMNIVFEYFYGLNDGLYIVIEFDFSFFFCGVFPYLLCYFSIKFLILGVEST